MLLVDYGPDHEEIITRGWTDPRNLHSIWETVHLTPDRSYTLQFEMEPHDYECLVGHQLGVVIISGDNAYTKRPEPGTVVTVFPEKSYITLPIVGNFPI